jgi:hypothetical protein
MKKEKQTKGEVTRLLLKKRSHNALLEQGYHATSMRARIADRAELAWADLQSFSLRMKFSGVRSSLTNTLIKRVAALSCRGRGQRLSEFFPQRVPDRDP